MKSNIYSYLTGALLVVSLLMGSCSKNNDPSPGPGPDTTKPGGIEMGAPASYTKKAIAEDFTGAWCGWCPRMTIILDELSKKHPQLILAAWHHGQKKNASGSGYDPFVIDNTAILEAVEKQIGVKGFPTTVLEREINVDHDDNSTSSIAEADASVTNVLKQKAPLGISLGTTAKGNSLEITVKVGNGEAVPDAKRKLMVYVVEDALKADQHNYYSDAQVAAAYKNSPYFGILTTLPAIIKNENHDRVVREVLTDGRGDEIPNDYKIKGAIYTKKYTVDLSKYTLAQCHVIAYVFGENNNGNLLGMYNAQTVVAGKSQQFD